MPLRISSDDGKLDLDMEIVDKMLRIIENGIRTGLPL